MADIAVTAGQTWIDIDAYACIIAYTELLKLEGRDAEAVNPGILNASIPKYLAKLGQYKSSPSDADCSVVLVDISDPEFISDFAKVEKVVEVYDHHLGFETLWQEKLGKNSHIEFLGACATLIWEEYKKRDHGQNIGPASATLLAAAIASNSLNFKAFVTRERDRVAFDELTTKAGLPENFIATYFRSCEETILSDIASALKNDTKIRDFPNLRVPLVIGQCELWESRDFIRKNKEVIAQALSMVPHWILTAPSISEGINHLYTTNEEMKKWLTQAVGVAWDGDFGTTDRLYMRKEIAPALQAIVLPQ